MQKDEILKILTKSTHCRHCGDQHSNRLRRPNHKNLDELEREVFFIISEAASLDLFKSIPDQSIGITKEKFAEHFNVPEHQMAQVFDKLNKKGILNRKENSPPHDSTRDLWGGDDSAWMPSVYPVRNPVKIK